MFLCENAAMHLIYPPPTCFIFLVTISHSSFITIGRHLENYNILKEFDLNFEIIDVMLIKI